jgi:sulfide dehydrogenase cytochrome subunit
VPNIAGQSAEYLLLMLRSFADDERAGSVMNGLARGYSAAELAALAAHFAALPRGSPQQAVDERKAARGRQAHEAHCARCHKDGGRRFDYDSTPGPVLAGQWLDYLAQSIQQFLVWSRQTPSDMGVKLLELQSGDIEALAHFYASQR